MSKSSPEAHTQALMELNFLLQVVQIGEKRSEKWRVHDAAERVIDLCEKGLLELTDPSHVSVIQLFSLGYLATMQRQ